LALWKEVTMTIAERAPLASPFHVPLVSHEASGSHKASAAELDAQVRKLQSQVAELQAQLAQAQRLTALGELISTTTHEFNNVLMTIINYAKLGMRHKDEPSRDKAFDRILTSGQRAAKICASVLGSARNRSTTFEPTDLGQIVDDALFLLERELKKYHIEVEVLREPAPPALAIGNQIQQVLLNLFINARQAMPQGGALTVRLAPSRLEGAATAMEGAPMIELVVRDTGCGIPPDKLRRIFDPFFSTKSGPDETGKGGTGLGLAFCRTVIEAHRGKIRVESKVGKGTQFTIWLPAAHLSALHAPREESSREAQ
jgi:signal transduction histidine kinase